MLPGRSQPNEALEEEEEAFIDLNDPNIQILDESNMPEVHSDDSSDENEEHARPDNESMSEPKDPMQSEAEGEDLNAAPDREPERDDALAVFTSAEGKPLHCITAHPTEPRVFAVGGESEEVYVLHLRQDGAGCAVECLRTLRGHTDTVSILSFSPNGEWLASGSLDSTVGIWSTRTWERAHTLTDLSGEILSLLWHPSSLVLVAGADDAQAAMWNVAKGTLAMYFVGHRGPVTCMQWSHNMKKLLTGSGDGSVIVFNPKTGGMEVNISKDLSPDTAAVTTLCLVHEDQCVVGCEDGTLHVLSLRSNKVATHLEEVHEQSIESLHVNSSATLLVTASCDCKVALWNVSDFTLRNTFHVGESVIPVAWLRDHLLVAGCSDGNLRVWEARALEQKPVQVCMGHRRMVLSLVTLEEIVATASDDGTTRFYRVVAPLSMAQAL